MSHDCHKKTQKEKEKKQTLLPNLNRNINTGLLGALILLFLVHLFVTFSFTQTVGGKLEDALAFIKPQEGSLTLISAENCSQCRNLDAQKSKLLAQNISLSEENEYSSTNPKGKALITRFGITKLPALVFETETPMKSPLLKALSQNGRTIGEMAFVSEQSLPPYFDIASQTSAGLVSITFLTDKSCTECSDIKTAQKPILERFGITIDKETEVDISDSEGIALLEKYSIIKIPTVILSPETNSYLSFATIWPQVGTIEADGYFVFRNMKAIQAKYRNTQTNEIVSTP